MDAGLRRVVVTPGAADRGKALECAVFLALRRRFGQVFYWRGAGEVDFIVVHGREAIPVQVTADDPRERHLRALDAFYEAHPHATEAVFVTIDTFHEALDQLPCVMMPDQKRFTRLRTITDVFTRIRLARLTNTIRSIASFRYQSVEVVA